MSTGMTITGWLGLDCHRSLKVGVLLIIPGLQVGVVFGGLLIGLLPGPLALYKVVKGVIYIILAMIT